jgi:hypothetical protein
VAALAGARAVRIRAALALGGALAVLASLFGMHAIAESGVREPARWDATYFANDDFTGPVRRARVSRLGPVPATARFVACLELEADADVALQLVASGGAALQVDGVAVVNAWTGLDRARTRGARLALAAGTHELRIDAYRAAGVTVLMSGDGDVPREPEGLAPCPTGATR